MPPGLTINPDAADGQTACREAEANFGTEAAGRMPRQLEDRNFPARHAGARGPARGRDLHRRAEAREPVPPFPRRPMASASTRSCSARPTRTPRRGSSPSASSTCRRCRSTISRFTSSHRIAGCSRPPPLHGLPGRARSSSPGTPRCADVISSENFSLSSGPRRRRLPRAGPALRARASSRDHQPCRRELQRLHSQARPR